jgi:hypothetical protein
MQTGLFGITRFCNEEPFRTPVALPNIPYSAVTDKDGIAIIRNVPAITRGIEVSHPHFQVPIQEPQGWRDRHIRMDFAPGKTNQIELILEPIGRSFIGGH